MSQEGMHSPESPAPSEGASCSPALQKRWEPAGSQPCRGSGCAAAAAPSPGAAALGTARNGGPQLGAEVGLQWGAFLTGFPQGCALTGQHRDGHCPPGQPSSGRCRVCGRAGNRPGWEPSCLFAQAPVAWGRSGAPGTCEPGEVVFGEGVPAPLPAESLITFCSIYSPLASWCFPSASKTWFPFERKRFFEMQNV